MAAFIIPTIFTAINRFSGPANQVAASMQGVASSAGRAQVALSNFSPLLDKTTSGLLSFARSAVLIGGIIGGITFSAKSIIDYDKALAKFRIVVDDLSDADFSKFKDAVKDVAKTTQSSMIDVANAFEAIAQISPEFAKTPAMIDAVTKSAITLSRASGMELKPAAEALTTIMNQNRIGAEDSEKVINILAASQAIGAASINQLAESYKNFGAIGVQANITMERSNAMFQVLAKNGLVEAEAGTKARRAILELQHSGVGYKSGKFDLVEALTTTKSRYDSLGSAMAKDAYLLKTFGEQGVLVGQILTGNIPLLAEYEKKVTGTNEANIQAAITTGTMAFKLEALKNAFTNTIIESTAAKVFMFAFGGAVSFLADHMGGLLFAVSAVLVPLTLFKGALMAISVTARIATLWTGALAFAEGFLTGATNGSVIALGTAKAALNGYTAGSIMAKNATLLLNVAIGLGVTALIGFISYIGDSEYAAYNATKGVGKMSEEYEKLGRSITQAEVRLKSLKDLQANKKESENLQNFLQSELDKGTLYGYYGAAKAAFKLGSPFSEVNPANIDIESKNLGLQNALYNESAGKALEDSLGAEIGKMRQAALDSAAGRSAAAEFRASTNVAAPNVNVNVVVNKDGTIQTTTNSLPAKPTQTSGGWNQ